jgi:hypothetical protein
MSFVIDKTVTDKAPKKRSFRSLLGTIVTPDKGPCSFLNAPYFIMLLVRCQGKSKCNSKQNRFASDQAVHIKKNIYTSI